MVFTLHYGLHRPAGQSALYYTASVGKGVTLQMLTNNRQKHLVNN